MREILFKAKRIYWCKESYVRGNVFDQPELLKGC